MNPSALLADGTSLASVAVSVSGATAVPVNVSVRSTTGAFVESSTQPFTATATDSSPAHASLRVGRDTGTFTVTAIAGQRTKSATFTLARAYPEALQLAADNVFVPAKGKATVTITALRAAGSVSSGTPISASLRRVDGTAGPTTGTIDVPGMLDSNGTGTVHFWVGPVPTTDSVLLVLASPRSATAGDSVRAQLKLYIVP